MNHQVTAQLTAEQTRGKKEREVEEEVCRRTEMQRCSAGCNQGGDASRCRSDSSVYPSCCGDSHMHLLASSDNSGRKES